jgi:hypothetical protein
MHYLKKQGILAFKIGVIKLGSSLLLTVFREILETVCEY